MASKRAIMYDAKRILKKAMREIDSEVKSSHMPQVKQAALMHMSWLDTLDEFMGYNEGVSFDYFINDAYK